MVGDSKEGKKDSAYNRKTPVRPSGLKEDGKITAAGVTKVYGEQIYNYVLSQVEDPSEAESLTREILKRVHQQFGTMEDPAVLCSWLFRIAAQACYERFKEPSYRLGREPVPGAFDDDGEDVSPEERGAPRLKVVIDRADTRECVSQFLERLSDGYRAVLLLHGLHGMTNEEMAEAFGCSVSTVRMRLQHALEMLKTELVQVLGGERGVFLRESQLPSDADFE